MSRIYKYKKKKIRIENTCKRAYSYYTMFRHSINRLIQANTRHIVLCCNQSRKERDKKTSQARL